MKAKQNSAIPVFLGAITIMMFYYFYQLSIGKIPRLALILYIIFIVICLTSRIVVRLCHICYSIINCCPLSIECRCCSPSECIIILLESLLIITL